MRKVGMEKQKRLEDTPQRDTENRIRQLSLKFAEIAQASQGPLDLVSIFTKLYAFLYTNSSLPRAERLAAEMVRLLFCKLYDEKAHPTTPAFHVASGEAPEFAAARIRSLFEIVKREYPDIFASDERLLLDDT